MELLLILTRQMVVMCLLMAVGVWLFNTGRITIKGNKELGNFLLYVILPSTILNSFLSAEYSREKVSGLLCSFIAAIVSLLVGIIISRMVFGNKHKIEHFGTAFSNAGFMGIPIVQAVIGQEAVFYVVAYVALLNILQWTYGVVVMSGKKEAVSLKKLITNPIIISTILGIVIYLLQVQVVSVFKTTISHLAGMNAPVAMVILGVYLAQIPFKELFTGRYVFISTLLRLVVIPLITIWILLLIPSQYIDIRMATLIAACAPVGSNVAIFAELNGLDYGEAVKCVCVSTIISVITMPAVVGLAASIWK